MKNILTVVFTTIFSILFITVMYTIAELNIVAKTEFTNQLQQSVIINASYFITCKLIVQIVLTYLFGHLLYHKVQYITLAKRLDSILNKEMSNINKDQTYSGVESTDVSPRWEDVVQPLTTTNINADKVNPLWTSYPERMQRHKDNFGTILDIMKDARPLTPDEAFKSTPIDKDVFEKVNTLQFDPINQVDEMDKNGITTGNNIKIKDNHVVLEDGIRLKNLLKMEGIQSYTFRLDQIEDNKRWIEVKPDDKGKWSVDEMMESEHMVVDDKDKYYRLVK